MKSMTPNGITGLERVKLIWYYRNFPQTLSQEPVCLDHKETSEVFKEDILRALPQVSASMCLLQI
jgi:hypothetical protein